MAAELAPNISAEPVAEVRPSAPEGRVTRNATVYFLGQIVSWTVTILAVSVIPRRLGESAYGQLVVAGAAIGFVEGVCALGIETYLTREVGRDHANAEPLLRATLGLRLALFLPMILASFGTLLAIHADRLILLLGAVCILNSLVRLLSEPMRGVLAGWENAKRVSVLDVVGTCYPLLAIPFLAFGPISMCVALVVTSVAGLAIRCAWVAPRLSLRPTFDLALWRRILQGSVPFALSSIIAQSLGFIAVIVLRHYADDAAVGVYSQAGRLFGAFMFVPSALGAALLPSLSRLAHASPPEFRATQHRVLGLLLVIGIPVTAAVVVLAQPLCQLLYGTQRFVQLPLVLQVYALAVVPLYITSILYQFLVAQNRNGLWVYFMMGTVALYAAAAAILTPWGIHAYHNGAVGAVLATCIAETTSAVCAFVVLRFNPLTPALIARVLRTALATSGMAAIMFAFRHLPLFAPVIAGAATFVLLATVLQVFEPEERARLASIFRRFSPRAA